MYVCIVNREHFLEQDPKEKRRKLDNIIENVFPTHLTQIEKLVGATEGDFAVGNFLTYADFTLASWLDIWEDVYGMEKEVTNLH